MRASTSPCGDIGALARRPAATSTPPACQRLPTARPYRPPPSPPTGSLRPPPGLPAPAAPRLPPAAHGPPLHAGASPAYRLPPAATGLPGSGTFHQRASVSNVPCTLIVTPRTRSFTT